MPIVIGHNPAQLIGDLSQNSGQYATGMENAQFAAQQQRAAEQLQLERDRMAQQDRLAQQQMGNQQLHWVLNSLSQQQLEQLHEKARDSQIQQQIGGKVTLAGINGSNRANVAQMHDNTQRYGIDQRTGVAYDRMDQQGDQFDEAQQNLNNYRGQKIDLGQARVEAMRNSIALRMANGNPAQARQIRIEHDQAIAANKDLDRQLRGMASEIHSLETQRSQLQKTLAETFDPGDADRIRSQLDAIDRNLAPLKERYRAGYMGAARAASLQHDMPTTPEAVAEQWNAPTMGTYAGDATPAYGGGAPQQPSVMSTYEGPLESRPPAIGGNVWQPNQWQDDGSGNLREVGWRQAPPPAMQQVVQAPRRKLPPAAVRFVQDMKAQGMDADQIMQGLQQNFGISE